ncbi:hypothetical protein KP509_27G060300 [Ceratopteris richardii]|uniref:SAC domain-containing protein n=1 Tax=Ceratopteris richardii TaxID=49495 RepID=A0A8T2RGQ1_CERRI|nr:hypothetical protein KP509_27G060300 [Ceratopteris richardii]
MKIMTMPKPGSAASTFTSMKVYKTRTSYYLIGKDSSHSHRRVLKIDRSEPAELNLFEDPATYTKEDVKDLLGRLDEGNRFCGGLKFVIKAYGLVGFIRLLKPYYMILITKRKQLGSICGHPIFGVQESKLFRIPHHSVLLNTVPWKIEERYIKLFNLVDLSKGFFYSNSYRIMWSLQRNALEHDAQNVPFDDMFVWNSFLTREFRTKIHTGHWTVALIHGFFKQVSLEWDAGKVTLTLIARRSRHFAGTRYLKRGVNTKGRVANDVETEQIVYADETDQITSVVQHRGSIPLFWSQETSVLTPKPDITLIKTDPTYEATKLHFQNLEARYGKPILVLNLIKTKEKRAREVLLCREFADAVAQINNSLPESNRIKFIQLDMHMFMKSNAADLQDVLELVASDAIDTVGFFHSEKATEIMILGAPAGNSTSSHKVSSSEDKAPIKESFQHGVLRSNCIDCLDRTNVSQYAFGLVALGRQLHKLGLQKTQHISRGSCVLKSLMEMYNEMGDVIALQYGGSPTHNKVFLQWQGKSNATIQPQEFLRSIMRHFSNAVLDGEKQDAMNIFLGHFQPEANKLALWEMDYDNHLHLRRAGNDPNSDLRMSFKRSYSAGNLLEQNGANPTPSRGSSELDTSSINKLFGVNPALSISKKRVSTINEAELKKCLPYDIIVSDTLCSLINNSTESLRTSLSIFDAGWLDSQTNSCCEPSQDRHFLSTGLSSKTDTSVNGHTTPQMNSYHSDDYIEDFFLCIRRPSQL